MKLGFVHCSKLALLTSRKLLIHSRAGRLCVARLCNLIACERWQRLVGIFAFRRARRRQRLVGARARQWVREWLRAPATRRAWKPLARRGRRAARGAMRTH